MRFSCSSMSIETCSSRLARSKWSMDLLSLPSFLACSCLSLICSWMACCLSWTLSTFSPSSNFFPRTLAASISALVSSASCSSISLLMRSSSLLTDSVCSLFFSSSARSCSSWILLDSSSFSFSCSICSYSSFLLSMMTFLAKMRLCSWSTCARISSMAARFLLVASSAASPAPIMPQATFSLSASWEMWFLILSDSSVCAPQTTTLFLWSILTARWAFLTASTRSLSTSPKS